jgi:HAD superfamily hydrolase (TIGR01549 family)
LSEIRAIYFDLDDTLCGYWAASSRALEASFEAHRPETHSTRDLLEHWATAFREFIPEIKTDRWYPGYLASGEPTRTEQMRRALAHAGIGDLNLASQISETYMRLRNENLTLFPDAIKVLDMVHARYPLGLITNGPADIQRMEIATLGIGHYFANVFIEGEVGFGKPEPEVFQRAARAVEQPPEHLLFVGNSYEHDILPAIAAGWSTAWIRRPSDIPPSAGITRSRPEERKPDQPAPTYEIKELSELIPILGLVS